MRKHIMSRSFMAFRRKKARSVRNVERHNCKGGPTRTNVRRHAPIPHNTPLRSYVLTGRGCLYTCSVRQILTLQHMEFPQSKVIDSPPIASRCTSMQTSMEGRSRLSVSSSDVKLSSCTKGDPITHRAFMLLPIEPIHQPKIKKETDSCVACSVARR
ncbi:hypothetical protein BV25DRAFT_964135 [Artomyces pyxidatus]|uniref:Uncharacterized protein n=1 Tax=Artomyces pyxidatus TaxID=48021 RepID=A0ACB8SWX6_9AGAM|nr:hypothetical protein BV25DRAFT_964135 [Artomyces pyxidatus]